MNNVLRDGLKKQLLGVKNWLSSKYGFTLTFTFTVLLAIATYFFHYPIISLPIEAQLGILQLLPAEYYVAIALSVILLLANFSNKKRGYFFSSMLLVIFLFICLEVVLYCNPVGGDDAYGRYTRGIFLLESANPFFSTDISAYPYIYCGSFLFMKVFSTATGIGTQEIIPFLSLFKVIATLCFFSLLYFLLARSMGLVSARLLTVLMVFANPYFQFHYSPPAFGLLFMVLLIYTVIVPRHNSRKMLAIQIMLFIFLVITHGPYALYFTMAYLFTSLLLFIFRRREWTEATLNARVPLAFAFTAGMLLMNPSVTMRIKSIITRFFPASIKASFANSIDLSNMVPKHFGYSAFGIERFGSNYILPEMLRVIVLASCLIATVWGSWVILRKKKMDGVNIFLLGATGSMLFFTLGNFLFPTMNLGDRSFLYLIFGGILLLRNIVPHDLSLSWLIKPKRHDTAVKNFMTILAILLFVSPLVNGLAYHYHNGIYFTAPQYGDRYLYVNEHSSNTIIYYYRDNHYTLYSEERFLFGEPPDQILQSTYWFYPEDPKLEKYPVFIVLAEPTEWSYSIAERDNDMQIMMDYADQRMNQVYSSIGTSVWYKP